MLQLDWLQAEWQKDTKVDDDRLEHEALRGPELHSKWHKFLSSARLTLKREEEALKKLHYDLWRYYSGQMDEDDLHVLGRDQVGTKILRGDTKIWIDADTVYSEKVLLVAYCQEIVDFLKSVVERINWRGNDIRTSLDARKFLHGLNS